MNKTQIKIPQRLTRAAALLAAPNEDGKTVKLSISSDEPYLRYDWFNDEEYYEVLDHGPGGVDMERLKSGLPILFNHDRDRHLARSTSFENDGHKISVMAKFSDSPFAQEKLADVKAGVLVDSSVGYEITGEGICIGARDEKAVYKFPFKIYEGSLVTIPADPTVGVGRQRDHQPEGEFKVVQISEKNPLDNILRNENTNSQERENSQKRETNPMPPETNTLEAPAPNAVDAKHERAEALKEFKSRVKKIREWVEGVKNPAWKTKAQAIADKHCEGDANFDEFRAEALNGFTVETAIDTPEPGTNGQVQLASPRPQRALSIGSQFTRSKEFKAAGGRLARGQTIGVEFPGVSMLGIRGKAELAQRAGFVSSDLSAVNIQIQPGIVGLGMQRLTIMDVISDGAIGAAALLYPRENSFGTVDGVAVPANTYPRAKAVGERGLKPMWDPDLTTATANVRKVAITTKVPDEFMADFPAAQSFIDARLPYMVDLETEFQILYGDGLNNNLSGIFTQAGVQTRAIDTTNDSTIAISLKKGLTDIEVNAQFEPDFYAFHPYDWETASLLRDSQNRFLGGGPFYIPFTNGVFMELYTFWGKPVVKTTSVTQGQPIAGCGKLGAQYFIREGMRIEMTNANEDDFRRNLIALRAEHRLTVATYRPVAFLEFTGFPART